MGALNVKKNFPQAIIIFVLPPSRQELLRRLVTRGRDTEKDIIERFEKAKTEVSNAGKFDYVVVNDKLPNAVSKVEAIIETHKGQSVNPQKRETAKDCRTDCEANKRLIETLKQEFYERDKALSIMDLSHIGERGIGKSL